MTSNCICPAYVRTPLVENQIADQAKTHGISEDEVIEKIMLTEPAIKRLIEPEEVAELAAYLCAPAASFINGASLVMDRGATAHSHVREADIAARGKGVDMTETTEGTLLWEPSEEFKENTVISRYMKWLKDERNLSFGGYGELWEWSVTDLARHLIGSLKRCP